MKSTSLIAALPLALALSACGEPLDGSDTANLEGDAVSAPSEPTATGTNPAEDGMLQTEVEPSPPATDAATGAATTSGDMPADDTAM